MKTILAIDQGTSSTRARLYSLDGSILFTSQVDLPTYYPRLGYVEQDGDEIWGSVKAVLEDVKKYAYNHEILACGIANQRETSLLWERESQRCIGPAIVWQDRRTAAWCAEKKTYESVIQEKTGLVLDPYFSASKVAWMLEHYCANDTAQNKLAFGTVDSYLLYRLTDGKVHATDCTNASRTMLYDIHRLCWDRELLDIFAIPFDILPQVYPCDHIFGYLSKDWFGYDIPVCGIAGDQQAALVGQCLFDEGSIKSTYGTGGFLLMNTGDTPKASSHRLITTIAYGLQEGIAYGLEGSIYQAGTMIQWLRDGLGILDVSSESETLASSISHNDGVYIIPSYTGMGAPYWTTGTGAQFHGLSLNTSPAHLARACLEAVAYQTKDVLDCMMKDAGSPLSVMRVDGGMTENNWLLQRLADQCQLSVERPLDSETTVFGAAMIAALGAGLYNSTSELSQHWKLDAVFDGNPHDLKDIDEDYHHWKKLISEHLPR